MGKLQTFIWGVRDGFKAKTALFPDRNRLDANALQTYNAIVSYFSEEIDLRFRACDRDFYFIIQAAGYYLYSYVDTKHQDYKDRKAYLVYSIAVPLGEQILGDLNGVLMEMKEFYQKRQGSQRDDNYWWRVTQNQFTANQIEEITGRLSLGQRRNSASPKNNIFLSYGNEALPQLGTFHGNNVYFIPENSNQSLVDALGFKIESLSVVSRTNEINRRFAEILSNRNEADIHEAKAMIASNSSLIEPNLQTEFNSWLRIIEEKKEAHQILNDFHTELTKIKSNPSASISRAKHLYEQYTYIANSISQDDNRVFQQLLDKHREVENNDKIQLIRQLIDKAEKSGWAIDPNELKQHEPYRSLLTPDLDNKIKLWNSSYGGNRAEELWKKFIKRHEIIKQAKKHELKRDLEELKSKVANLEFAVNALPLEQLNKFKNNDDYQYLISYKWVPRERRMAPFILVSGIVLAILAGGYYFLNFDTKPPVVDYRTDSDGDHVNDDLDIEQNSPWFSDTTLLKNYKAAYPNYQWELEYNVDSLGRIDTSKTKLLCDCLKDTIVKPVFLKCPIANPPVGPVVPPGTKDNLKTYIDKLKKGSEVDMTNVIPLLDKDKQRDFDNHKLAEAKIKYDKSQKIYLWKHENAFIKVNDYKILRDIFGLDGSGVSAKSDDNKDKDTDGDGVADKYDQCPDESGKVKGCPDRDNDGVADKNDKCPNESGKIKGCPDRDKDGVADKDDKCPDVPGIGIKGCPFIEEPNADAKTIMGFQLDNGEPNVDEAIKKGKAYFENLKPNTIKAKDFRTKILRKL